MKGTPLAFFQKNGTSLLESSIRYTFRNMSSVKESTNVGLTYTDPKTGKFVPGNPGGGRQEGSKNFTTIYRDALKVIAEKNGKTIDEEERELVEVAIDRAKKGDYRYYQDIMDRLNGKAVVRTENKNLNADVHKLQDDEKERLDGLIK